MQDLPLSIHVLPQDGALLFWKVIQKFGFEKDRDHYLQCLERQQEGAIDFIMAHLDNEVAGFCILNWQPKYAPFKNESMPEIQDLNVLSAVRRQGIGREVIEFCENQARANKHQKMGIGVGLDSSFGAAQRLYVKMGYVPDGAGVNYDRKQIAAGEFRPIDENLCIMMSKVL